MEKRVKYGQLEAGVGEVGSKYIHVRSINVVSA